jgi:hypothetical protein
MCLLALLALINNLLDAPLNTLTTLATVRCSHHIEISADR